MFNENIINTFSAVRIGKFVVKSCKHMLERNQNTGQKLKQAAEFF
jgi:hypothetical protein